MSQLKILLRLPMMAALIALLLAACGEGDNQQPNNDLAEAELPEAMVMDSAERVRAIDRGRTIAQAVGGTLMRTLITRLQTEGAQEAVEYCNVHAIGITDSVGRYQRADVKRTALRIRNPENRPTAAEKAQLEAYANQLAAGQQLEPVVNMDVTGLTTFYAPIILQTTCLQCHGEVGTEVLNSTYGHIKKRYPVDQAVGFDAGDLRGMWSISWR